MATAEEIVVKLTAQTAELKAGMAEGAAVVKTTQDEMAASMQTSMNAFREFDSIQKGSIQTAEQLAAAQSAVQAAQASGAFTAEEVAEKEALVAAAMKNVGSETQAAAGMLSMFTRNSRTMYSTSALITDAMTGQFSRMRREVAALGNETGLMAQAFRLAVSPIGLVTAALAAAAALAIKAHEAMRELQGGLEVTGNAAKLTKPDLDEMSAAMQTAGLSAGRASDALKAIVSSGKFTAAEFGDVGVAAGSMADMTGTSVDKVVGSLESMASGSASSIAKVNERYNFLSVAQAKQIKDLIDEGHNAEAAAMAYRDLAAAMQGRDADFNKSGNLFDKWLGKEGQFWSAMFHGGDQANDDAKSKLGSLAEALNQMAQNSGAVWQKAADGTIKVANAGRLTTAGLQQANAYLAQYNALTKQIADSTRRITDNTNNANKAIESANAVLGAKGSKKGSGMSGLEEQFKEQEAKAHASYDQMKIDAADFWSAQATDARNSAAVQADAWQKYIDARHQLDAEGLRNESEADRKRTEAAKRAAEGQARAMKQAQAEIQDDIRKTGRAMDEAMRKQITDAQQAANASVQAATQTYQRVADALQERLRLGEITSQQEVGALRRAAQEEYEDKRKALQGELALVQQKPQEVARVNAQIEQLERKHDLLMQKLAEKAALDYQKTWQERLRPISNAFDQMINGMMQGTQTLGQAMRNMLQNIAASFIQMGIDTLTNWIANEIAKREATQTTAVQQIANAAGVAGAQGVASFAGAPWPIDIGAPAFGAAMALDAMAYQSMASAARGWERVPADGMLTQLHRDEMVLPKHVADPIRNMARGGGNGGGSANVHIHAMDARSFGSFLKRNPAALRMALAHAGRNGW